MQRRRWPVGEMSAKTKTLSPLLGLFVWSSSSLSPSLFLSFTSTSLPLSFLHHPLLFSSASILLARFNRSVRNKEKTPSTGNAQRSSCQYHCSSALVTRLLQQALFLSISFGKHKHSSFASSSEPTFIKKHSESLSPLWISKASSLFKLANNKHSDPFFSSWISKLLHLRHPPLQLSSSKLASKFQVTRQTRHQVTKSTRREKTCFSNQQTSFTPPHTRLAAP